MPEFVVQPFHPERGRFVRGTRDQALELCKKYEWTDETYNQTVEVLRAKLPVLLEGKDGFEPA